MASSAGVREGYLGRAANSEARASGVAAAKESGKRYGRAAQTGTCSMRYGASLSRAAETAQRQAAHNGLGLAAGGKEVGRFTKAWR